MIAPTRRSSDLGVRTLKFNHGGVMTSSLRASVKNGKTFSRGTGSQRSLSKTGVVIARKAATNRSVPTAAASFLNRRTQIFSIGYFDESNFGPRRRFGFSRHRFWRESVGLRRGVL